MKKLFTRLHGKIIPLGVVILFFVPSLIQNKIPIPADSLIGLYHPFRDNTYLGFSAEHFPTKNPLITDPVIQTYPWRFLTIDNLKNGELPLWNPYSFSGQPLLANIQSASLQFINFLYFALPFNLVWAVGIIIAPALTSLFMYLLLRSFKISKIASAYGSFVLPFCGFFISWLTWGTVISTAMWLPLILYCINKVSEKISAKYFLILVFSIFQTVVSGHWQTAFYVFVASTIYLLFKAYELKQPRMLVFISLSFLLGALVSSIQILPSLEFINLSNRAADQAFFPGRQDWFLPLENFIQLISPDFFGNPTTYNYWGIWNYAEFVSYIGIVPLFFALLSVFKKSSLVKLFWFLVIFSLVFAIKNPISQIPYLLNFPFISSIQPSRIIFILEFALSVLCAFGLEFFLKENFRKKIIVPALVIFLPIIGLIFISKFHKSIFPIVTNLDPAHIAFRNLLFPAIIAASLFLVILLKMAKVPKIALIIFLFILTTVELFRFSYKFTPFSNLSIIYPSTQTTTFLKNQQGPFRILVTDRRILNGNISSVYKIEQVSGYDPLYLKSYAQLVSSWNAEKFSSEGSFNRIVTPTNYSLPLASFLNVKYLLTFDDITNTNFQKVFQEGQTRIYENRNVLPRVFFVNDVQKVENQQEELTAITSKNFNFKTNAVSTQFQFSSLNTDNVAKIKRYTDQEIEIETKTREESPLLISNVNYPGWKANVDGNPTSIKEVNFMFQSLIVPAGDHIIKLSYFPKLFVYGLYITIFGIIATLFIGGYLWKKEYR